MKKILDLSKLSEGQLPEVEIHFRHINLRSKTFYVGCRIEPVSQLLVVFLYQVQDNHEWRMEFEQLIDPKWLPAVIADAEWVAHSTRTDENGDPCLLDFVIAKAGEFQVIDDEVCLIVNGRELASQAVAAEDISDVFLWD